MHHLYVHHHHHHDDDGYYEKVADPGLPSCIPLLSLLSTMGFATSHHFDHNHDHNHDDDDGNDDDNDCVAGTTQARCTTMCVG